MPESTDRELLSFDDAQILSLESDSIKGHTGKVLVLDPGPNGEVLGTEALRGRAAERIVTLKRLAQRVDLARKGAPAWVGADDLDLGWHIADAGGEPRDDESLRAETGRILATRLDHERPLWRLDVIPVEGGRTALVGRIHHAMADGVSAIALVGGLLWDVHEEDASHAPGPDVKPGSHPPAPPPEPAGRAHELRNVPGALRRELRPGADTRLDRHIGPGREVARAGFPLKRLKAIGHAAGDGVTVNDVVLATVAGGLRGWLDPDGDGPDAIRVQVPVCLHLRDREKTEVGNHDSFMNVDLPLHEPDAEIRLRRINEETSLAKLDHDAETLYSFFHAVGRFRPMYRGITRLTSGPREFALSVSNVPGPRDRPTILGHEIDSFVSFAEPADRHALRVSVVSLGGDLAFGLCSDPEAVGGLDALAANLEVSVAELESAVGAV